MIQTILTPETMAHLMALLEVIPEEIRRVITIISKVIQIIEIVETITF